MVILPFEILKFIIQGEKSFMPQLSLKLPEPLYQELLLKKEALGLDNMSDVIRFLLRQSLENPSPTLSDRYQKRALSYSIMSYCLIEEGFLNLAEEGSELCDQALKKAQKLINKELQK